VVEATVSASEDGRVPYVVAALRQLPPRRRLMVFLRSYADLSYAEIAECLGVAEGTIAATLSQAYAVLRESLQDEAEVKR
jgi:RNA polymerase sigma factor (sigma-70 family)